MIVNLTPPKWAEPIVAFVSEHPKLATFVATAVVCTAFGYWLGKW